MAILTSLMAPEKYLSENWNISSSVARRGEGIPLYSCFPQSGQRLCLKAVMADIAEIVVHDILHFQSVFYHSLMFHQDTFLSQGSPQY